LRLFQYLELPFCKVLLIDSWNSPAHRYFISYSTREDFRHVLGLPVIDEYATFSSPVFFAPNAILGKIYNAGISLAHMRDAGMGMETGWPPLCIGLDESSPQLPPRWERLLIDALQTPTSSKAVPPQETITEIEGYSLQSIRIGQATIFATSAPLVPRQLKRISQIAPSPFAAALSTGNRIVPQEDGVVPKVEALSEKLLKSIIRSFEDSLDLGR
jgi:hypothetical protein